MKSIAMIFALMTLTGCANNLLTVEPPAVSQEATPFTEALHSSFALCTARYDLIGCSAGRTVMNSAIKVGGWKVMSGARPISMSMLKESCEIALGADATTNRREGCYFAYGALEVTVTEYFHDLMQRNSR